MNHHILISGATGGLGSCLVKRCIKSESIRKIHFLYRDEKKLNALFTKSDLEKVNGTIYSEDHSYNSYKNYIEQIVNNNNIDVLTFIITAFSIEPIDVIGKLDPVNIEKSLKVNIEEMVSIINLLMSKRNFELRIININSGAAYRPLHGWSMYCASKAFVNMFLETLRKENPGMKVVTYEPGVINTKMQQKIRQTNTSQCEDVELFKNYYLEGKLHDPDKVANDIFERYVETWSGLEFTSKYIKK